MHVNGSCHCGSIRFEADIEPDKVVICHCDDCQIMSGTVYRISVATPNNLFRLISGVVKSYIKVGESGNRRKMVFCADCGSHLYATNAESDDIISIRVGTLSQRKELIPTMQVWCRSAQPWAKNIQAIPGFDKQKI